MADKDVTAEVEYGDIDGDLMELQRCVCGAEFDRWAFVMSLDRADASDCPACGRRLYFSYSVTVLEV
jgi:hypothetical protein